MTIAKAINDIREIMRWMKEGEIHLLIRKGEIKYIDILHEYKPDERDATKF